MAYRKKAKRDFQNGPKTFIVWLELNLCSLQIIIFSNENLHVYAKHIEESMDLLLECIETFKYDF